MISTLRLEDCGDFLNAAQYLAWRGDLSLRQLRRQIRTGKCFVMPCEEKPRLKWRRSDCERAMANANVIKQRAQRAKAALGLAVAS